MYPIQEWHIVFGKDYQIIIIILNIIILATLLIGVIKKYKDITKITKLLVSFIIAGGTSNLIDRIFRGYVVDYIDINKIINYPIFNIADISIVLGCALLGVCALRKIIKNQEKA